MNSYLTLQNKSTFKSNYLNDTIYNYLDNTFIIPQSFMFDIIKVKSDYIARPDLISYDIYGTDFYADIICKLNGISNPFELNEGDILIIPSLSYITKFNQSPPISELEKDDNISEQLSPKAKTKNEKRKPNEAIIGDKRFTIDSKKRVIIY